MKKKLTLIIRPETAKKILNNIAPNCSISIKVAHANKILGKFLIK